MQNFKNLKVWVRAHEVTLLIYQMTKAFPRDELYGLTSQLRRSISSIPANIAEGCGKRLNRDLCPYLNIALGSANESEYFLLLSHDLSYLKRDEYLIVHDKINEIKAMLISLISKVKSTEKLNY